MTLSESAAGTDVPLPNGHAHLPAGLVVTHEVKRRPPIRRYPDEVVERVRRLVTQTDLSIVEISKREGPSEATILNWIRIRNWPRPAGAPPRKRGHDDPAGLTRHGLMMTRLHRALSRQLKAIEKRATNPDAAEKDARALSVIAKTYETLTALRRNDEGSAREPELPNRADVTARLADRIARWAEGRTEA